MPRVLEIRWAGVFGLLDSQLQAIQMCQTHPQLTPGEKHMVRVHGELVNRHGQVSRNRFRHWTGDFGATEHLIAEGGRLREDQESSVGNVLRGVSGVFSPAGTGKGYAVSIREKRGANYLTLRDELPGSAVP